MINKRSCDNTSCVIFIGKLINFKVTIIDKLLTKS